MKSLAILCALLVAGCEFEQQEGINHHPRWAHHFQVNNPPPPKYEWVSEKGATIYPAYTSETAIPACAKLRYEAQFSLGAGERAYDVAACPPGTVFPPYTDFHETTYKREVSR